MKNKIKQKIILFFQEKTGKKELELDVNYFDEGYIDSLAVIELIAFLENEFNIQLSQDDFIDRRFSTINGLVQIVKEKLDVLH